jgi:hypothetical protein
MGKIRVSMTCLGEGVANQEPGMKIYMSENYVSHNITF